MSWTPISGAPTQYQATDGSLANGYYLKFYAAGTTTPINMATNSSGVTLLDKCEINAAGYPVNGSGDIFVPHIDQSYKIVLYTTAADADLNLTANADWVVDNLQQNASVSPTQVLDVEYQLGSAASGQVFTLTAFTYTVGISNLQVYRNGVRLRPGASFDYEETSNSTITVNSAITIGASDVWTFAKGETSTSTAIDALNVSYLPAGTGAQATNVRAKLREHVSVKDFGAAGDGVTDDTAAIQAAFNHMIALGFGGTIFFPRGVYRITDTIEVSDLKHVTIKGDQGAINANPTIAQTQASSSCIFWDGADLDVTAPMFFFRRGNNNDFENLVIQGRSGFDGSGNRAYAGIWVDENHESYRLRNCKVILCYIGVRVCSSYNFADNTYNGGLVRYDSFFDATANSFGGFASDNWAFENCTFGFNTKAGISIESAQALDMRVQKTIFTFNAYGCFLAACQGITFDDPTFLVNSEPGIWLTGNASSGNIVVNNSHQEDGGGVGSDILFEVSGLVPGLTLGKGITFNTCGGGDIIIRGASGTVTINNSILPTVSMKSAGPSLVIRNSTITELDKTAALGPGDLLHLENVNVTTTLASNWNGYDNIVLIKTDLPSRSELAEVPLSVYQNGQRPSFMLSNLQSGTSSGGMEGVSFRSGVNFLFIGVGCYTNASGTWIASNAAGARIQYLQGGISYEVFSGATPGAAIASFTTIFASNTTVGLQLPSFAADPSATVGTLYYNTTTGKVRRRDAVGWADV